MEKLTITDINKLENKDIKKMTGTVEFTSAVSMGIFIKKIRHLNRKYEADYTNFSITFN